jgi:probable phosphoglycerate mutase
MANPNRYGQRPYEPPPGSTELLLVRHGASAAAREDVPFPLLDGRGDPALDAAGHAQADAVGAHLAQQHVTAVFVSPLTRTRETAAPLLRRTRLEPRVVPELAEVRLGEFEGGEYRIRAARRDPVIERAFAEERWDVIPGAEPAAAFGRRVARAVELIVRETGPSARAAVFAHGGVIGEICRQVTGSRPFAFVHADNGSVTSVVVAADGRQTLRAFNETAHLAALRSRAAA